VSDSTPARRPGFPYMRFARTDALTHAASLTQSGMPAADRAHFAELPGLDLEWGGARALPELTDLLAQRFRVRPEQVFLAPGATGAMSVVAAALFGPGNRVAVEVPSYEPLRVLPRREGAAVILVRRDLDRGWRLDPAAVESALRGPERGHVFLSSPHNPSGVRTSPAELATLAELAARRGGYLVCNEIYEEFVPEAQAFHAARDLHHGISLGSLTKAYGLGALRVGWVVLGEAAAREREAVEDATYLQYVDLPTSSLRAAHIALRQRDALLAPYRRVLTESRPLLERWLASEPRVEALAPEHGIIACARVRGVGDTLALARHLAAAERLGVVPGEHFGAPGHLRLGYGMAPGALGDALERLSRGLGSYSGR
jgi:aspartate/methionine/tyrosine aminotransferase